MTFQLSTEKKWKVPKNADVGNYREMTKARRGGREHGLIRGNILKGDESSGGGSG